MKEFIILIASILLGLFIYNLVLGDGDSIRNSMKSVWEKELTVRNYVEMVDSK